MPSRRPAVGPWLPLGMLLVALVAAVLLGVHVAGPGAPGVLTGRLLIVGGPAPGLLRGMPDLPVSVRSDGRIVASSRTDDVGGFHFRLVAGTYQLTTGCGNWTVQVVVESGRTTVKSPLCDVP